LNTWKRYWSATGVAVGNISDAARADKMTVADVSFRSLTGDTVPGAVAFSVEPSAAAVGPVVAGATGAAGLAELQASEPATSAHTPNRDTLLRFIENGSRN
jgi:hypothetical protein